ncbi:ATP-dependent helicase HepA [Planctomycetes bacterium Pla163]|uniref:ATP-dependent helicase HepA n=1 Tax=Rohdeia mirabilis TaxID=2528008 RepID=A0A518D3F4_9BACT|nr:ATP-dependent helicase HepA [Planctomycetes bacterium Pla163]
MATPDPAALDARVALHLGQVVPRRTRLKAHDYVAQGAVDLVEVTASRVLATVRGGERYSIVLERVEVAGKGTWYGRCTCPAFAKFGPCKHLYAAALECLSAGHFDRDGGAADADRAVQGTARDASDWRAGLARVGERFARSRRDPWPGVLARTRLSYELVERNGRACLEVVVDDASEVAPPEWADLARLGDELDRAVLARLADDRPARTGEPVALDPARAEAVLPLLAHSGRLTFGGDRVQHGGDGTWTLALGLEPDGSDVVLTAGLAREGAWSALDEPSAWPALGWAVAADDRLLRLAARPSDVAVLDVARQGGVRAPVREAEELRALAVEAGLPGLGPTSAEAVPRGVRLELEQSSATASEIDARILFDYGGSRVRASSPSETVTIDGGATRRRSREAERLALGVFIAAGGRAARVPELTRRDGIVPRETLDAVLGEALERDWELGLEGLSFTTADELSIEAREESGELVLAGFARFGARRLSLDELLGAGDDGRLRFEDGTTGLVGGALRRALAWAARLGRTRNGELRIDTARGWLAAPLLAGLGATLPESVERARAAFDGARTEPDPPRAFEGELRPYQSASLGWFDGLERLGLGGCLADDMGLGKTVQVLARLVQRREQGLAEGPSLVVAPRSVVHHWREQAARFAPFLDVAEYSGAGRDLDAARRSHVVLVTYGTLRQDAEAFAAAPWDLVVLDESQQIKNAASQTAAAARGLVARARLALSGTPVENHLGELASLMAFLNPGLLGRSATALEKLRDERSARELLTALAPVFLRRTKDAVLSELPPRTEVTLWCELEGEQAARYEALRRTARAEILGETDAAAEGQGGLFDSRTTDRSAGVHESQDAPSPMHVLAHLTRLRQAACHAGLLDESLGGTPSAKFRELLPRLERLAEEGRKALVFSQFTGLLHRLAPELDERGLGWELLDGRTRNRAARVRAFQESDDVSVFLISLKAGGTGLDLTAADTVFLLDPWWNPAAERQAIDRVHRIGQTRPVLAYRLLARDTVEERVARLAASKGALLEELFASESLGVLDRATLESLL